VQHQLEQFLRALRAADVKVSPAEAIDAARPISTVGYADRELFKDALCATLAKSRDEVDKSDEAFEAFLLEVLSAYQVSVPELGVIKAKTPPLVFLTSNNVRDLGDALKRRCLHLHIPLPEAALEERIVATRVPGIEATLTKELVAFVQSLRTLDLRKAPSISETVDWARALILLHADSLDPSMVRDTLNVILKFEQDIVAVEPQIVELLHRR
jgi:MoxR-like ATPase